MQMFCLVVSLRHREDRTPLSLFRETHRTRMESILFTAIVLISVSTLSAKHVVVCRDLDWPNAQTYCRKHHTDLSPISNQQEYEVFKRCLLKYPGRNDGWVGLYLNKNSSSDWSWSGGADSATIDYVKFNPSWGHYIAWSGTGLDSSSGTRYCCFCFNLMVDDEVKKTWEEALEYCRETHTDLTSLHSETERLLALSEIQHDRFTARVWIGLRFLGDRWLWVDGDPMVYENWRKGDQKNQCPLRNRCGALTKEGHWENWDCEDQLNFICY